jgi:hypothetical protein
VGGVVFDNMKLKISDAHGIGADMDDAWLQHCEKVTV